MESNFQEIKTSVRDRNQLRQRSFLPLLDEANEIARAVAISKRNEQQAKIDVHKDAYLKLHNDALHDLRSERGASFPQNSFGRCVLVVESERRFHKYLLSIGMVDLPIPCIPSM